jgi:hypothetical protein
MSIFEPMAVQCPACQGRFEISAVESVNADRRPDLRTAILDRSFQVQGCPRCKEQFRLDPAFNYLDVGRGQWFSVQPLRQLPEWIESEDEAVAAFARAYGDKATGPAREIGKSLRARLVFGWAAVREKIIAADSQLDDVTLELLKLALIQGLGNVPLRAGNELRLDSVEEEFLEFEWIRTDTDQTVERMRVPQAMYDGIVNDPDPWAVLRKALEEGPLVDMQKLYFGPGRAAVA